MKHALVALLLGLLAALPGRPAFAQLESREAIALNNQIAELRHDIQDLRDQIGRSGGGGSALGGYRTSAPAPAASGSGDLTAQLLDRVSALEDQVRQLRGRMDEADNARDRMDQDLSKQIADLNFKVDGLTGAGGAAAPGGTPPAGDTSGTLGTVPPAPAAPAAPARRTPELAMQEGNAALARRDYTAAEASAREVLAAPRSPRDADANFLLARALAGKRDWARAAVAYDDTYKSAPSGAHAQDALVGLASALVNLNQKPAACGALARLRNPRQDLREQVSAIRQHADCRWATPGPLAPAGLTNAAFAALMAPLGPFEPAPSLAVAVSGGADSMALVLLADAWARRRGGSTLALVVDHGLRRESAAEAALTQRRLKALGIDAIGLALAGLEHGPGLAARARAARHAALIAAAADRGILHLLFGHHAGDQAETVAMRRLAGSGPAGLSGMAALVETARLRLLRPLIAVPPGRLRATLRAAGVDWVEDPSNADPASLRARLRAARGDAAGDGLVTRAAGAGAAARGRARAGHEAAVAAELAARVSIHPEGYALLSPGPVSADALAALARTLAGAERPPSLRQAAALAAAPRPATLGGVRLLAAGRLGPGWLIVREAAAMRPAVVAHPGAVWDGRFRLAEWANPPAGCRLGPLGAAAAALRRWPAARRLPAAVLATLPALHRERELVAVPHLLYPDLVFCLRAGLQFAPPVPMAGAGFVAAEAT